MRAERLAETENVGHAGGRGASASISASSEAESFQFAAAALARTCSKEIMRKYLKTKDERALDESYNELTLKVTRRVPYPTEKGIQAILEQLKTQLPAARTAKPADFVDTRFLEELEESGYIQSLYR